MASDSGFDGGQENSSPITPVSSVMDRLRRLQDGLISSPRQVTTPVTSPRIRPFLETPALTSNYEPPPLNDSMVSISSIQLPPQQQIIPHRVTPVMLLHDEPPTTQDLVSDEFRLQLEATQQITQGLDEAQDMEYKQNKVICEAREAREATDQRQETLAQF